MSDILFRPFTHRSLSLKNRIVMAPMTRGFSPSGILTPEVIAYYQRRAKGKVGLIISEGTIINRPSASNNPNYPHFYGPDALRGWKAVAKAVHGESGCIAPQLWHLGIVKPNSAWSPPTPLEGPSGLLNERDPAGITMSLADIAATIEAFAQAAGTAQKLKFDAIELHGAHGYLIDQFFWSGTNRRSDHYGGKTIAARSRFALDIVKAIRRVVGPDFPIILRISQWKQQNHSTRHAETPQEIADWLVPLAEAGVDIFHCSQRQIWDAEFKDSPLNFAAWVKKITGVPTIAVGCVGLTGDFIQAFRGESSEHRALDGVIESLDREEFDLVAVGRALLVDPDWVEKIRDHRYAELKGFQKENLQTLF